MCKQSGRYVHCPAIIFCELFGPDVCVYETEVTLSSMPDGTDGVDRVSSFDALGSSFESHSISTNTSFYLGSKKPTLMTSCIYSRIEAELHVGMK